MIRQDFSMLELQRLSRHQFSWQWLPASGHSGGILLGVREEAFSVEDMDRGEFFVSMAITERHAHLSWEVIIVYGPADHARSVEFLAELKNKIDPGCVFSMTALRTWRYVGKLALGPDWLRPYASSLLVGGRFPPRSRRFRFETFWLDQPGFCELVHDRWHRAAASPPRVYCAVDIWQHCAKTARQAMKGWGANLGANLRARKGALLGQIKSLDDLADGTGLSPDDWTRRYSFDVELMGIFRSEELFWQRRGGQNWLLKGDANTAYFQDIANGRRRKCVIPFLWDGDALLESPEDISSHIYSFYKELFSANLRGGSSLCEDFWPLADQHRIADNLNCKLAAFPISYLGMPLAESRILVSGFDPLVGRVASRAEPWCGRFTSKGSKSILISSNLASLSMYMMGMYILPEGVHSAFDKELARFFCQAGDGRPKYHMVKWADICVPKDRGGLGIPASRRMNVALMLRWVWRILHGDGGLWLQLIEAKYLRGRPLLACSLANGSQFWKSIQSIKHEIRLGLRISVGDGSGTQFWLDPWLEGEPLRFRFPRLFAICADPAVLVSASALEDGWHVAFRRPLGPVEVQDWELLLAVIPLPASAVSDSVSWSLSPSGESSVSSAYLVLCRLPVLPWLSPLWKAPLPFKIKIFVWQLLRDRLPSGTEVLKCHGRVTASVPCAMSRRLDLTFCSHALRHRHFGALYARLWDRSGRPLTLQIFCRCGPPRAAINAVCFG
ncbi:hypothetical protein D1007_11263 [Hordeum vulgare]|nr:hypothetical protein D1007_11263 [Hordeum vulgare]